MLCLCSSLRHPGDVRRHPDAPDARGGGTAAHGGQRQRGRGGIARLHGLHCVLFLFLDLNACHKVYAVSQAILQYHDHWFDIMGGGTTLPCSPGVSQRSFQLEVFSCCARAGSCQALGLSGNQTSNPGVVNAVLQPTRVSVCGVARCGASRIWSWRQWSRSGEATSTEGTAT